MASKQSKKVYLVVGKFVGFKSPMKASVDHVWGCPQVFESKKEAARLAEMMRDFCLTNGNMSRFSVREAVVQPSDPDDNLSGSIESVSVAPYRADERSRSRVRHEDKRRERADGQAVACVISFEPPGSAA